MSNSPNPSAISGLSAIAGSYRAILCDVWGVVHNSFVKADPACAALAAFRAGGGRVMLITNAPRPSGVVIAQLDELGVSRDAYDDVITSGDVTRHLLAEGGTKRVLKIGPERDAALYEGLPLIDSSEEDAAIISCTGLFDDLTETVLDYEERLQRWARRHLPMVCANPDIVVERGHRLVYCAGAIAQRYEQIGGRAVYAGKPHRPIYDEAIERLSAIAGAPIGVSDILAIGDGLPTDVRGGYTRGLDVLFITAGIHASEWENIDAPSRDEVGRLLGASGLAARAFMPRLAW
jgi:HAD superfamily hydrolase (TIGR01459 family)